MDERLKATGWFPLLGTKASENRNFTNIVLRSADDPHGSLYARIFFTEGFDS